MQVRFLHNSLIFVRKSEDLRGNTWIFMQINPINSASSPDIPPSHGVRTTRCPPG
jgi:hypothetical protein